MISTLPALAAVLLSIPGPSPLADLYVDAAAASCATGTGAAADPVCSIGAAISLAAPGDTIRIAPGTYSEFITIPFSLNLIGTAGASVTTIEGPGPGSFSPSLVAIPASASVSIDNLTLKDGSASSGGAVALAGTLSMSNCSLTGNRAFNNGAAVVSTAPGADLTITDCSFVNNIAVQGGGAIRMDQGSCSIFNSELVANRSERGGAILFTGTSPTAHTLEITDSAIQGNRVSSLLGFSVGGGISQTGGSLVLNGSTIASNSALQNGGGAGLSLAGTVISINNSTIASNIAGSSGGGLSISGGRGSISSSTLCRNSSQSSVSGGLMAANLSGPLTVHNSIIALNTGIPGSPPTAGFDVSGNLTSLGHNLIGDGGTGFTNGILGDLVGSPSSVLNPMLAGVQDNGGPTRTIALLPGSPALDAGDPLIFEPTDQRGVARPHGFAPDMGAFEAESHFEDFCNGDGGDQMGCTDCPCNNNAPVGTIGGCLNAAGLSARLHASGNPFASNDTMRMEASGLESLSFMLLTSAAAQAPAGASNPCFGANSGLHTPAFDGLRCVVQDFQRHGSRSVSANGNVGTGVPGPGANGWGGVSNPPAGLIATFGFVSGQTRYFQGIYRTISETGCMRHLTTTQGIGVTFGP